MIPQVISVVIEECAGGCRGTEEVPNSAGIENMMPKLSLEDK